MKKQTLIGLAIVIISGLLFFSFKTAQTSPKKYVTVRIIEGAVVLGSNHSQIVVAYDDGKTEEYALKSLSAENFAKNTITLNDILNDFSEKGYHLDFVTNTGAGNGLYLSYIFSK